MENEPKKLIDLETARLLLVQTRDKDSFADFTGSLRQNWPFVMAFAAISLWLLNGAAEAKLMDNQQGTQIERNTEAITTINTNFSDMQDEMRDKFEERNTADTEILRRLDVMQKDIDTALKNK